jgi:hypothetical protein
MKKCNLASMSGLKINNVARINNIKRRRRVMQGVSIGEANQYEKSNGIEAIMSNTAKARRKRRLKNETRRKLFRQAVGSWQAWLSMAYRPAMAECVIW